VIYLDTHAVIWLREGENSRFSRFAKSSIDAETDLVVSPMVLLELENLHEIGRVKPSAKQVLEELGAEVGLRVCTLSIRAHHRKGVG
jgi:PIN domain nuclease of toxin-antitoxin system